MQRGPEFAALTILVPNIVPRARHITFFVSPRRGSAQTHSLYKIIFPLSVGGGGVCGEEEREEGTQMPKSSQVIQKIWATQGEGRLISSVGSVIRQCLPGSDFLGVAKLVGSSSTGAIIKQFQDLSDAWKKWGPRLGMREYVTDIIESA